MAAPQKQGTHGDKRGADSAPGADKMTPIAITELDPETIAQMLAGITPESWRPVAERTIRGAFNLPGGLVEKALFAARPWLDGSSNWVAWTEGFETDTSLGKIQLLDIKGRDNYFEYCGERNCPGHHDSADWEDPMRLMLIEGRSGDRLIISVPDSFSQDEPLWSAPRNGDEKVETVKEIPSGDAWFHLGESISGAFEQLKRLHESRPRG